MLNEICILKAERYTIEMFQNAYIKLTFALALRMIDWPITLLINKLTVHIHLVALICPFAIKRITAIRGFEYTL